MSKEGDETYQVGVAFNNKAYGEGSLAAEIANNNLLGNVTLKDDLGTYGGISTLRFADDLDERTRDRLISHTRQDVASAFAHALSAFKAAHEAKEIAKSTRRITLLVLVVMLVLVFQGFVILRAVT